MKFTSMEPHVGKGQCQGFFNCTPTGSARAQYDVEFVVPDLGTQRMQMCADHVARSLYLQIAAQKENSDDA